MIIVDENLKELIHQHKVINTSNYDVSCVNLSLDNKIMIYNVPDDKIISYEIDSMTDYASQKNITKDKGYILKPHECILACSKETINMPNFCFGLLQTKGSLARLFVFLNCSDGQIDPGFNGKVTFELFNASNFSIKLTPGQMVGNLYIFKTTTEAEEYHGRYQNAKLPTVSVLK